ncbi:hypothetical protein ACCS89_20360, partial [Rhizobium johnstonii]
RYRTNNSNQKPLERTQNWIKLGGKVRRHAQDSGISPKRHGSGFGRGNIRNVDLAEKFVAVGWNHIGGACLWQLLER